MFFYKSFIIQNITKSLYYKVYKKLLLSLITRRFAVVGFVRSDLELNLGVLFMWFVQSKFVTLKAFSGIVNKVMFLSRGLFYLHTCL